MFIVYKSVVDGYPRARKVSSFREAGMVIATLELMGVEPEFEFDPTQARPSALPLIVEAVPVRCT